MRIQSHKFFPQPVAGCGHQPQLVSIVKKRSRQHSGLLKKIAVKSQRRDHVPGVMRHFRNGLALAAERGQGLHHRFHTLALRSAQSPGLFHLLHGMLPFLFWPFAIAATALFPSPCSLVPIP